jgi:pyruvate-ferredoxin/flavodoxin oxidoreductase
MQSIDINKKETEENWNYAFELPERGDLIDKSTVRGSQSQTPLLEFSGGCSGCGDVVETPYFKLLTQFLGERIVEFGAYPSTNEVVRSYNFDTFLEHYET